MLERRTNETLSWLPKNICPGSMHPGKDKWVSWASRWNLYKWTKDNGIVNNDLVTRDLLNDYIK